MMSDGGWVEVGGMTSSDLNVATNALKCMYFMEDESVQLIRFQIYAKNWNIDSLIQDRSSLYGSLLWSLLRFIPFFKKTFDNKLKIIDDGLDTLWEELSDLDKKLAVKIKVNDIWSCV